MMGQAHVSEDDFDKARELLQSANACGTETAMVFNYRFFDQTLEARRQIAKRQFGALVQVTGLVHYACWSHCIDLVHHFGGPVAEMTALAGALEHRHGDMLARDVTAAFTTIGGASGAIIGTAALGFQFPLLELSFCYEGGRVSFRGLDGDMEILDYSGVHHETFYLSRDTSRWDQYNRSFDKAVAAYLDAVRAGAEPPVPGIAGLQELQFEAALKRSITTRRPVAVQDEFPLD